jgi:hypothetical protein
MRKTLLIFSLISFAAMALHAQTNDPHISQQYYIGAHNIDQLWNTTTGSSNTRIAIHSATGFTSSHEDMTGSRYLNPFTNWFAPEKGFASELAGIVGANSNNGIGIAGINWNAVLRSYNFVEVNYTNPEPGHEFTADNVDYYFNVNHMSIMLDEAINDNMNVHLFTFGVPTSNIGKLSNFDNPSVNPSFYRFLHEGPKLPSSPPPLFEEQYISDFLDALQVMGTNIWNAISGSTYSVTSPYENFRSKLYEAAENQNGILIAPVGDVIEGTPPAPILMPLSFDDFVIGVGGGELDAFSDPIHWEGAGTSPYVNVTAAATDIVTITGGDFDAYNTSFSSTQASAAIVAGVASLLKTELNGYSYEDIRHVLQNTAIDIEDPGFDEKTGHGWVDAQAAIEYIQNNDFVRKSVQKNDISTIQDSEDNSYTYLIDVEIAVEHFGSTGCASTGQILSGRSEGLINTFRGRIDFDYKFNGVPDVWLNNTSSGTDVNPGPYGIHFKQYYEPYEKNLSILSVDETGFEFEMKYWGIKIYNSNQQLICYGDLPNMNNIQMDYTAVGDETDISTAPPETPFISGNISQGAPNLSWNSVNGAVSYQINRTSYHPSVADATFTTTSTTFLDNTLPFNVESTWQIFDSIGYTVQAVSAIDIKSGQSNQVLYGEAGGWGNQTIAEQIPDEFNIHSNYPNPFNPTSTIRYDVPEASAVLIEVYNMLGQRVAVLVDQQMQPGYHEVVFDASSFASGNYIARFVATGSSDKQIVQTLNMQLIK